jgi:hypothetical protein
MSDVFGFGILVMVIMSGKRTTGFCPNTQMTRCKKMRRTAGGFRRAANSDLVWVEMVGIFCKLVPELQRYTDVVPTNLHFFLIIYVTNVYTQSYRKLKLFILQHRAGLSTSFSFSGAPNAVSIKTMLGPLRRTCVFASSGICGSHSAFWCIRGMKHWRTIFLAHVGSVRFQ